jgi:hypothetical protein
MLGGPGPTELRERARSLWLHLRCKARPHHKTIILQIRDNGRLPGRPGESNLVTINPTVADCTSASSGVKRPAVPSAERLSKEVANLARCSQFVGSAEILQVSKKFFLTVLTVENLLSNR